MSGVLVVAILSAAVLLSACATPSGTAATHPAAAREEIYILRSIRELRESTASWCSSARTGFEPLPMDSERFFSLWSVGVRPTDGRIIETKARRVGEAHACVGATAEPARRNFYAEMQLGALSFHANGECQTLRVDFLEAGLSPVRCQLVLSELPAPYVGGLLTSNTMSSNAAFGPDSRPPGYAQASIATIRLWKSES
jgi:hypothetical protein